MNKIFRVIWSQAQQAWVVVSELTKTHGKSHSNVNEQAVVSEEKNAIQWFVLTTVAVSVLFATNKAFAATALGANSTLMTNEATSVVIGQGANAPNAFPQEGNRRINSDIVVIGSNARSTLLGNAAKTTVVGANAHAGDSSTAIGWSSSADTTYAVALGYETVAHGDSAVAAGRRARAGFLGVSLGLDSEAVNRGLALGERAKSYTNSGVALGSNARVGVQGQDTDANTNAIHGIAIGSNALVTANSGIAIGIDAKATKDKYAVALGYNSNAQGISSFALGYNATSVGGRSIAMIFDAYAEKDEDVAIGHRAKATGGKSLALMNGSVASANEAIAIGFEATSSQNGATAVGRQSKATSQGASAFGPNAQATADWAVAIGSGAVSSTPRSVALGDGASTATAVGTNRATVNGVSYSGFAGPNPVGTVSVGSNNNFRTITNVAAGRIEATSTDAINGSQLYQITNQLQDGWAIGGNPSSPKVGDVKIGNNNRVNFVGGGNTQVNVAGSNGNYTVTISSTGGGGTAASSVVAAGKNTNVTSATANGVTTYTVNADKTTVSAGNGITVTPTTDNNTRTTNYKISLNNEGIKFLDSGAGSITRNLGQELRIRGEGQAIGNNSVYSGENIRTFEANGELVIKMRKDPSFTKVTTTDGFYVTNGPTVNATGINAGNKVISSVANGAVNANSKEAVNGSQLFGTNQNVTNLTNLVNKGWTLTHSNAVGGSASGTKNEKIAMGDTVTIEAAKNINIVQTNKKIAIATADDVSFNSVTIGSGKNTTKLTSTANGLDVDGDRITNVANGTAATDAVNLQQLNASKTAVEVGAVATAANGAREVNAPLKVTSKTNADGSLTYNVSAVTTPLSVKDGKIEQFPNASANRLVNATAIADAINNSGWFVNTSTSGSGARVGAAGVNTQVNPSNNVTFIAGDNLRISQDANRNITYSLNPTLSAIQGITMAPNNNGINMGGGRITNLGAPKDANDATTKNYVDAGRTAVISGDNSVTVTNSTDQTTGKVTYDVRVASSNGLQAFQVGNTTTGGTPIAVNSNKNRVNIVGQGNVTTTINNRDIKVDLTDETKTAIQEGVNANQTVTNKGITFQTETGSTTAAKLGDTVKVNGDQNINTSANGDTINVKLNPNVNLTDTGSVSFGPNTNAVLNKDGLSVATGAGTDKVSVTKDGINAGNKTITNVSNGTNATDAVNLQQLNASKETVNTTVVANGNNNAPLSITTQTNPNGSKNYQVVAQVTDLKINADGTTALPNNNRGGQLMNATAIMNAINSSGWNVTTGVNGGTHASTAKPTLVTAGNTVSFLAGNNIIVDQDENRNITYSLNPILSAIQSITMAPNNNGINMGGGRITNLGAPQDANDATTKNYVDAGRTAVTSSDQSVSVTPSAPDSNGKITYDLKVAASNGGLQVIQVGNTTTGGTPIAVNGNDNRVNVVGEGNVTTKIDGRDIKVDLTDATKTAIQEGVNANQTVTNKGITFQTETGSTTAAKLGDTVKVNGDQNINTSANGDTINVKLNPNVNLTDAGSVSFGPNTNAVLNKDGLSVATGAGTDKVSVTKEGINAGNKTITNVSNGTNATDAVNLQQLNASKETVNTTVVANGNDNAPLSITTQTNPNGSKNYQVVAQVTDLKINPNGTVGLPDTNRGGQLMNATAIMNAINSSGWNVTTGVNGGQHASTAKPTLVTAGNTVSFLAGNNIIVDQDANRNITYALNPILSAIQSITMAPNNNGINMGGGRITNLGAPQDANDATTKNYVDAGRTAVVSGDNSVTVTNSTDQATGKVTYDVRVASSNGLQAIQVGNTTTGGTPIAVNGNDNRVNVVGEGNVTTKIDGRDIKVDLTDATKTAIQEGVNANQTVTNKGITFQTGAGSTTAAKLGDTVKVSGDQNINTSANGDTINVQLNPNVNLTDAGSVSFGNKAGNAVLNAGGLTLGTGDNVVSVTNRGINAGNFNIENVAPAELSETSKQAVNGSQLYATNQNVTNLTNEVAKGWNITHAQGQGGEASGDINQNVKMGDTVTIEAGKNINLVQAGRKLTISTIENPTFTTVTATNGVTIGDKNGDNTVLTSTPNGLDVGGDRITNVGTPVNPNDATTKQYVDDGRTIVESTTGTVKVTESTRGGAKVFNLEVTPATDNVGMEGFTLGGDPNKAGVEVNKTNNRVDVVGKNGLETAVAGNTVEVGLDQTTRDNIDKGVEAHTKVNNDGITFTGDSGATTPAKLGDSVKIKGDNNIVTSAANGEVTVGLKPNVNLTDAGSVSFGDDTNAVLNKDGLSVATGTGTDKVSVTKEGISAGNKTITNVSNGTNATDAVNLQQLNASTNTVSVGHLTPDANAEDADNPNAPIRITTSKNPNGSTNYNVSVVTAPLSVNNGAVVSPSQSANRLVTASSVAEAINNSGWFVNTGVSGSGLHLSQAASTLVKPSNEVQFIAGDNLRVNQAERNITFSLNPILSAIQGITMAPNNNGINMNDGRITNLGAPQDANDATTKKYVDDGRTIVTSSDNTVRIEETNRNGARVFDLKVTPPEDNTGLEQFVLGGDPTKAGITVNPANARVDVVGKNGIETNVDGNSITVSATTGTIGNQDGKLTNGGAGDTALATVNNVVEAVNSAFWTIGNETAVVNNVKNGDDVRFKDTDSIKATVSKDSDNKTVISFEAVVPETATTTLSVSNGSGTDGNTDKVGNLNTPVGDNANSFVKAGDLVNALNNMSFNVANGTGDATPIKAGDTVRYIGKDNVNVTRDGNNFTFALNHNVTLGNQGVDGKDGSLTVQGVNGKDGVTIQPKAIVFNGVDGKDGQAGQASLTFVKGEPGLAGNDGQDGKTRMEYTKPNGDKEQVATLNDGLRFQGDVGEVIEKKLNETLNIKGNLGATADVTDKNLRVDNVAGSLILKMARNLTDLTSAQFKDDKESVTTVGGNGITITPKDGTAGRDGNVVSLTNAGLNNGGNQIVNVASGLGDTKLSNASGDVLKNGVNVGDLKTAIDDVSFVVGADSAKADENVTLSNKQNRVDIVGVNGVKTAVSNNNITVSVTTGTIGNQDGKLTNGGAGDTALATVNNVVEAVNSAFWTIGNETAVVNNVTNGDDVRFKDTDSIKATVSKDGDNKTVISFNAVIPETATTTLSVSNGSNTDGNTDKVGNLNTPVGDNANAFVKAGDLVNVLNNMGFNVANGTDPATLIKAGDTVRYIGKDNVNVTRDGNNFTFALNPNVNLTDAGSVKFGDTAGNAVLNKTGLTVGDTNNPIAVTNDGIKAGDKQITNVASGLGDVKLSEASGSTLTNAVNVGDLQGAINNVTNAGNGGGFVLKDASGIEVKQDLGKAIELTGKDGVTVTAKPDAKALEIALEGATKIGAKDGKDGSLTVQGADGKDGVTIQSKAIVFNGVDGKDGQDGQASLTFVKGEPGLAGNDGQDGKTRIEYTKPNGDKEQVATLNDGLRFQGDVGEVIEKKLNETLNIKGNLGATADVTDKNLRVDNVAGSLILKMARNLTDLTSAQFKDDKESVTTVGGNGITITPKDGTAGRNGNVVSLTNEGLNNGGNQIVNVASGLGDTKLSNASGDVLKNGVNVGDLKTAIDDVNFVVGADSAKADENVTLSNKQNRVDIVGVNGVKTAVSNNNITVSVVNTTLSVSDGSGTGDNNTKAGSINTPTGDNANAFVKAGDLVNALNNMGFNVANGTDPATLIKAGDTVRYIGKDNVNVTRDGNNFTFALNPNVNLTDAGSVKFGDTVGNAVLNGNGLTVGDAMNPIALTKDGITAGGKKITNVAEGLISADSKDAVNGSQLYALQNVANSGWNLTVNGTTSSTVKPNETVDLNNEDGNIELKKTGHNVTFALSNSVTLGGQGRDGADGKDGSIGVKGKDGQDGVTILGNGTIQAGQAGRDGRDGVDGQIGATGKDGASVVLNGKDGSIGLTGPRGADGKDGVSANISVKDGAQGVNGKDGVDGLPGANGTNRIVYTATDSTGTPVTEQVATLNDGLIFMGNNQVLNRHRLNTLVTIVGEGVNKAQSESFNSAAGNINVKADGNGKLEIQLAKNVNLTDAGSVKFGDTAGNAVLDKTGLTVGDTNNPIAVTNDGIKAGDKQITNVASGLGDVKLSEASGSTLTNAVNVGDLQGAINNVTNAGNGGGFVLKDASGIEVKQDLGKAIELTGKDGVTVTAKPDAKALEIALEGATKIGAKDGKDGSLTVQGADGKDGVTIQPKAIVFNGVDGVNGKDGADGRDGQASLTFVKGEKGLAGNDGKDGADGKTRIEYTKPNGDKEQVATLNDGLRFQGDVGDVIEKKLNETLNIKGNLGATADVTDKNLRVDNVAGDLVLKMARNLTDLTSSTFGDPNSTDKSVINKDGITISNGDDASRTVKLSDTGLSNGNNQITNVSSGLGDVKLSEASGSTLTNAVNVGDLQGAINNVTNAGNGGGFVLKDASGIEVKQDLGKAIELTGKDGVTVTAKPDAKALEIALEGATKIGAKDGKDGSLGVQGVDGKDGVTLSGNGTVVAGRDGRDGVDGQIGATGKDGASVVLNGKDGSIGLTGPRGADGKDGVSANISVKDGAQGVNGKDGVDGLPGANGTNRIVYTTTDSTGTPVTEQVATLNDGLIFTGNNQVLNRHRLNTLVTIVGEGVNKAQSESFNSAAGNINVKADGNGKLEIQLAKNVNLTDAGSVKFGDTAGNAVLDKTGLTVGDTNNPIAVTNDGIKAGDKQITNVASGLGDVKLSEASGSTLTNAVNVGDLQGAINNVTNAGNGGGFVLKDASGIEVKQDLGKAIELTGKDGVTVTAKPDAKALEIALEGATKIGAKDGKDGSLTVQGADGKDGVTIQPKAIVFNGVDGKDGQDGQASLTFVKGEPGLAGNDGQDGKTRMEYTKPNGDKEQVATLNDGLRFQGDVGEVIEKKLNETLNIKGNLDATADVTDKNLRVDNVAGDLVLKMARNLTDLTSSTFGDPNSTDKSVINKDGITISNGDDANRTVRLSDTGLSNGNNQITNVSSGLGDVKLSEANGSTLTNAVNVGDLQGAINNVTNAGNGGGFGLRGDDNAEIKQNLGSTIAIKGDSNDNIITGVKSEANGERYLEVRLNKDLQGLSTAQFEGKDGGANVTTLIAGNGVHINTDVPNAPAVTLTQNGLSNGDNKITNVKAGEDPTDAVNVSQLTTATNKATQNATWNLKTESDPKAHAVSNQTVELKHGANTKVSEVKVTKDASGNSTYYEYHIDVTGLPIEYMDADGDVLVNVGGNFYKQTPRADGSLAPSTPAKVRISSTTPMQLSNVAKGTADTDAVNVSQLKPVAQNIGGDVDASGNFVAPNYQLTNPSDGSTTNVNSVKGAIETLDRNVNQPITFSGDSGSHSAKLGTSFGIRGDEKNITTEVKDGNVRIALKDNVQLHSAQFTNGTSGSVTNVNGDGVNISQGDRNPVSLTINGLNNGGNRITNVAAGEKPTDAVNVSQLRGVAQNIAQNINKIDRHARAGIASAGALANLPQVYLPGKSAISFGSTYYRGEAAYAMGYSRISDNGKWIIKATGSTNTQREVMVGAGASYIW